MRKLTPATLIAATLIAIFPVLSQTEANAEPGLVTVQGLISNLSGPLPLVKSVTLNGTSSDGSIFGHTVFPNATGYYSDTIPTGSYSITADILDPAVPEFLMTQANVSLGQNSTVNLFYSTVSLSGTVFAKDGQSASGAQLFAHPPAQTNLSNLTTIEYLTQGAVYNTTTDINGFYNITLLPANGYNLEIKPPTAAGGVQSIYNFSLSSNSVFNARLEAARSIVILQNSSIVQTTLGPNFMPNNALERLAVEPAVGDRFNHTIVIGVNTTSNPTDLTGGNSNSSNGNPISFASPGLDLSINSTDSLPLNVVFAYNETVLSNAGLNPMGIQIFHYVNNTWLNMTVSRDTVAGTVTGRFDSLGPIGLGTPLRHSILTLDPVPDVPWGMNETVTGTLSDNVTGRGLAGAIVTFSGLYDNANLTAITTSHGAFSATFTVPSFAATGWIIQAHFAGDILHVAQNSSPQNYNTVRHITSLSTPVLNTTSVKWGMAFNVTSAVLFDSSIAQGLAGKSIIFNGTAVNYGVSGMTGTDGALSTPVTVNASATVGNAQTISAHFAGDSNYAPSDSATPATIQIAMHEAVVALNPLSDVHWGANETVTGTLTDNTTKATMAGATITLSGTYSYGSLVAVTTPHGAFSATLTSPATAGSGWMLQAHFAGDSLHLASDSNLQQYNTLRHTTSVSTPVLNSTSVKWGRAFSVSSTVLTDSTVSQGLSGRLLMFNGTAVNSNSFGTTATGGNLLTPVTLNGSASVGSSKTIIANFAGDSNYAPSSSTPATIQVLIHNTNLAAGPINSPVYWGTPTSFPAALTDADNGNKGVPGVTITFNGTGVVSVANQMTNTLGLATGTGIAPSNVGVGWAITAKFAGTNLYNPAISPLKAYITIPHKTSMTLAVSPNGVLNVTGAFGVSGSLIDTTTNSRIANQPVMFNTTAPLSIPSTTTNSTGGFSKPGLKSPPTGTYWITANFPGQKLYLKSSSVPGVLSSRPAVNVFYSTSTLATKIKASASPRVAYVEYLFTMSAYSADANNNRNQFYAFYNLNAQTPAEVPIYSNLQMLTAPLVSPYVAKDNGEMNFFQSLPKSHYPFNITILTDLDVHNGNIFNSTGQNKYDVLILGHNEYMTQQEYSNLKKFVTQNGGSLVLMDGDPFYAEVTYDATTNSITYLHGHGFEYFPSLKYAIRHQAYNYQISPGHLSNEWWYTENSQWIGSNFIQNSQKMTIVNNIFNVRPWEDNGVTNSMAQQLLDYNTYAQAINPTNPSATYTSPIEAYQMQSGKGHVFAYGVFTSLKFTTPQWLQFLNYCVYQSW